MNRLEGWHTSRFDEFGSLVSGSTPSTAIRAFWEGDIVWVTPYDLSRLRWRYLVDSAKKITTSGLAACSAQLLPAGSIVMSSRAPIGYVAIPRVAFCTNQGCKGIKLKSGYDPEFTYYNILFNIDKVKALGEGTTFAEISKSALSGVELAFPDSTPEQTKIAEVLSTVDRAIEQTEALIAKQQRIKTGLMQDLLTRGIDEHGNLRSEETHQFKDSPLGRIPVEWDLARLGDFATHLTSGSRGWGSYYASEGAIFLRIGNLTRAHIDLRLEDLVYVRPPASAEGNRTALEEGDLLVSITADLGIIGVIPSDFGEAYVNQHIALVRLEQSEVNPRYAGYALAGEKGQKQFTNLNESGAKAGLNLPTVKNLQFSKPTLREQLQIALILDRHAKVASHQVQYLAKLRRQKAALMQDLLTGKKRVTPPAGPARPHCPNPMTDQPLQIRNSTAEFLIFTAQAGDQGTGVRYEDGTVWLTQKMMGELFGVDVRTVSEHLGNIFASNELQQDSVIRKLRNTAADGKRYNIRCYSLDAIISVGYRVNSIRATQSPPIDYD